MTRNLANPVAHVCRVCGRPAQLDDLCRRHGGSFGLIIQTEDLYSRAQSVMGGTSQIQKNIVATRILGLPAS